MTNLSSSAASHSQLKTYKPELAQLREALKSEHSARLVLSGEINQLKKQLSESLIALAQLKKTSAQAEVFASRSNEDLESEFAELWFSEQALYDVWLSEDEVEQLRQRFDQVLALLD